MRLVGQDDKKGAKSTGVRVSRLTGPGPTVAARAGLAVLAATAVAVGCTGSEGARGARGADEEVHVDHWEYPEWDRSLHPGDIVLTHFRGRADWNGTMPDVIRAFLKKVTDDGYAVARLEDYL